MFDKNNLPNPMGGTTLLSAPSDLLYRKNKIAFRNVSAWSKYR